MLRVRSGVLLAVVMAVVWSAAGGAAQRGDVARKIREARVHQWIAIVNEHEPGSVDAALRRLQGWLDVDLAQLRDGLAESFGPRSQLPIKTLEERFRLLRRGAVLHTDLAMLVRFQDARAGATQRSQGVIVDDGQLAGFAANSVHWEIARLLIDLLLFPQRPPDEFISRWYRATAEFMIAHSDLAAAHPHLTCAQRVLVDEAHVWLASGVVHAHYAAPGVQNAIAGVEVPFGTRVLVNNRQTELILAERFLRRAVELEPGNAEAQLRYGWVLVQQKRLDPAFDALRAARATATESVLQYYALLFLAVAESAAGRHDAAIDLFEQAAPLFPTAQAPLLALSELAMRRGDRAASAAALQRLFGLPPLERVDPWWTYGTEYGRHWRASWSRVLEWFSGPKSTAPRRQAGSPCVALR